MTAMNCCVYATIFGCRFASHGGVSPRVTGSGTMLLFRAPDPRACGIVDLDGERRIINFTEKPEQPKSNLANAGVYVLHRGVSRWPMRTGSIWAATCSAGLSAACGVWVHDGYTSISGTRRRSRAGVDARRVNSGRFIGPDGLRPALFVDRTASDRARYISDPDDVRRRGGRCRRGAAAPATRAVVVSNQSAVGRGLMTEAQLRAVNERMCDLFAAEGVVFDALYHCPVAPTGADPAVVEHEDRKPGPGMLRRGASELKLDLGRSWMVGDTISDVLAGINAGCRGSILVKSSVEAADLARLGALPYRTAADLAAAATVIAEAPALVGQGTA